MTIEKQKYLQEVLETHRMSHIEDLVSKYKTKRDEIKENLENHYLDKQYSPFNSGSFAKHTAINTKFDLDLVVPFKRKSFDTIEAMFDDIYDFLYEEYYQTGIAKEVRKQKVSVGVKFYADKDGDEIDIDVVPGRELSINDFSETKDLNIYFNEDHWGFFKGTYTKTNIHTQIDHIKGRENARKIIRLLKIWKNSNREQYKSFLLELFTIKAFNDKDISGNLWEQLKSVMEYIKDNVEDEKLKLIDPGNSNNDVLSSMDATEKRNLAHKMKLIIDRIEEDSNNIKTYFPINDDYKNEKYEVKEDNNFSVPPTTQRFG